MLLKFDLNLINQQSVVIISSMFGFDNPISFKKVTDVHISIVEASIRDRTLGILTKNLSDSINEQCEVLVGDEELIDHFGPRYAHDTDSFRFEEGDKILITDLVDHVKKIADAGGTNCGLHHFAPDMHSIKVERRKQKPKKKTFLKIKSKNNDAQIDEIQLKRELLKKVTAIVECYNTQHSADPGLVSNYIDESVVELHVKKSKENGYKAYGIVHCVVCKNENRKSQEPKRVYYNFKCNGNGCWVMSNFTEHFKKVHKLNVKTNLTSKCKKLKVDDDIDEFSLLDEKSVQAAIDQCEELKDEEQNNDDDEFDLIANDQALPETNKIQDQFADLYSQLSSQITKAMTAVFSNSDTFEQIKFTIGKSTRKLTVANTVGDGNCLFYSLAHQLWFYKIGCVDHIKAAKKVRTDTVNYILDPKNFDLYEHQLHDCVYAIKNKNEIENLATECRLFVKLKLARNKTWAGSETLMAVSDMYATNIVVFNEDSTCNIYKRAGSNHKRTIAIAFRYSYDMEGNRILNHFESVCDMNADDLYAACDYINRNASKFPLRGNISLTDSD